MNERNPLTPAQRRAVMTGSLHHITVQRQKAKNALRQIIYNEERSHTTNKLISDWYSPLKPFWVEGEDGKTNLIRTLNRYVESLEARAHAYIDAVTELTGFGFFDFNDFLRKVYGTEGAMREMDRKAPRTPQHVYANHRVVAYITKKIDEEVSHESAETTSADQL